MNTPEHEQSFLHAASPQIGGLVTSLAKAQSNMEPAQKNSTNPHLKNRYADLASVLEATMKPLNDQGIAVIHRVITQDPTLVTVEMLMVKDEQWISSQLSLKPQKPDAQGIGSALSYARRYLHSAMCNIGAEDDDGNSASAGSNGTSSRSGENPPPAKVQKLNPAMRKRINEADAISALDTASDWADSNLKGDDLAEAKKLIDARRAQLTEGEAA